MEIRTGSKLRTISLLTVLITLMLLIAGSFDALAADRAFYVYFNQSDRLYRVRTDKGEPELLMNNAYGYGRGSRAGKYLVTWSEYYPGNGRTTGSALRLATDGSMLNNALEPISGLYTFSTHGDYIYFVVKANYSASTLQLYRMPSTYSKQKGDSNYYDSLPQIANMIDPDYVAFEFIDKYVYYTALRNGRELWVARKAADGSGSVTWICKGALESKRLIVKSSEYIYMMVNTEPEESQYSTDCMVQYKIARSTGKATALNAKNAIDYNAAMSGNWATDIYYYNTGVKSASSSGGIRGWDYNVAVGYVIDTSGRRVKVTDDAIIEMTQVSANKYVYCDAYGDVYSCNIKSGKLTNKKKISGASEIFYVRSIMSNGKRSATLMAGSKGTYLLNSDMSVKKLIGVEWDTVFLFDDMDGYLYTNAGDENKLYYLSSEGKTRALTKVEPNAVMFVEPVS